jgi:hypothetical protein
MNDISSFLDNLRRLAREDAPNNYGTGYANQRGGGVDVRIECRCVISPNGDETVTWYRDGARMSAKKIKDLAEAAIARDALEGL